jgi:hypothetical protein
MPPLLVTDKKEQFITSRGARRSAQDHVIRIFDFEIFSYDCHAV